MERYIVEQGTLSSGQRPDLADLIHPNWFNQLDELTTVAAAALAKGGIASNADLEKRVARECIRYLHGFHAEEERKSTRPERDAMASSISHIDALVDSLTTLPRYTDEHVTVELTGELAGLRAMLDYEIELRRPRGRSEAATGITPFLKTLKHLFSEAPGNRKSFISFIQKLREGLRAPITRLKANRASAIRKLRKEVEELKGSEEKHRLTLKGVYARQEIERHRELIKQLGEPSPQLTIIDPEADGLVKRIQRSREYSHHMDRDLADAEVRWYLLERGFTTSFEVDGECVGVGTGSLSDDSRAIVVAHGEVATHLARSLAPPTGVSFQAGDAVYLAYQSDAGERKGHLFTSGDLRISHLAYEQVLEIPRAQFRPLNSSRGVSGLTRAQYSTLLESTILIYLGALIVPYYNKVADLVTDVVQREMEGLPEKANVFLSAVQSASANSDPAPGEGHTSIVGIFSILLHHFLEDRTIR